jgi:flagellar biosynthesis/type III secretory pathway M-ring protein FliF/YscJ
MQAHNSYTHTFTYEGRLDQGMLDKANTYGRRARTAAIVSGVALVGAIVLLVVFPEHPDTITVGAGGDVAVRF